MKGVQQNLVCSKKSGYLLNISYLSASHLAETVSPWCVFKESRVVLFHRSILDSLGGRWKALDIIGPGLFSLPGKAVGDRTDIFIEPRYAGL